MLTNALRVLVNNLFEKSFYGKKKTINILTIFFISHKSGIKIFLKWLLTNIIRTLVSRPLINYDEI